MEQRRQCAGGGWPLGLHPMNAAATRLSMASGTSAFLISTPSLSSSSSDLDTESTSSFFPEKSTTLGSLIGIHSSSQLAFVEGTTSPTTEGDTTRRKRTKGHTRSRTCWSMLACGRSLLNDAIDVSPSLAHFLSRERAETLSPRHNNGTVHTLVGQEQGEGQGQEEDEEEQGQRQDQLALYHFNGLVPQRRDQYKDATTTASRPCGPTIRFILQHPSPTSYLSTDWNVCSDLSQNPHIRGHSSSGHGRFHTLWPSRCCRLHTSVAN